MKANGLTDAEEAERFELLELQKIRDRWFSQAEFERLRALTLKLLYDKDQEKL